MNEEPGLGFTNERGAQPSLGERLRAARVEKGLELAAIADSTRIPIRHLEAIENDNHDALPALPYTIGFVKTFARAVGYDGDEAVAQYRAETSKVAHVPQVTQLEPVDESRVPPRWLWAVALAVVIVAIAAVWAYGEGMFDGDPAPAPAAVEAQPEPAPLPAQDVAPQPAEVPADTAQSPSDAAGGVVEAEAPPADTAPTDTTAAETSATAPATSGSVVVTATEEVWFKVYDRATRQAVKMGTLKPGERYVVPGDRDDLLLWTGKAGALRLSVNGRTLPPLGGPEQMVKDVALTPTALLARSGG